MSKPDLYSRRSLMPSEIDAFFLPLLEVFTPLQTLSMFFFLNVPYIALKSVCGGVCVCVSVCVYAPFLHNCPGSFSYCSITKSRPALWNQITNSWNHAKLPCPSLSPWVCSNSCPLSQWCHPTISTVPPSPPDLNLSQHQGLFYQAGSWQQVAKILEPQLQSFQWIFSIDFL